MLGGGGPGMGRDFGGVEGGGVGWKGKRGDSIGGNLSGWKIRALDLSHGRPDL